MIMYGCLAGCRQRLCANVNCSCRDRLVLDPTEHPMLLAEPTFNTKALREQMVQAMFETYGCPALFLAKNAVLSSFATGRQTSLVVDAGHAGTVGEQAQVNCFTFADLEHCVTTENFSRTRYMQIVYYTSSLRND